MILRIIDIETTGDNPEVDAIVEIASVDAAKWSKPTNPMSRLVNPGKPIPPLASAVHHIVDADVIHAKPIENVIPPFCGADIYVAHNASFEAGFLAKHIGDVTWLCTYRCALRLWPDLPSHSNQALRYQLGYPRPFDLPLSELEPHRALPDCYVTAAVLIDVLRVAAEEGVTFKTLLAWSKEPPLMTTFRFGKHKGERFDAVPEDYLHWIVDKSDMDEGVKFSAQHWLAKGKEAA